MELSVVIPTLQKNKELLINLINSLKKDSSVSEIIIIDNSTKGFEGDFDDGICEVSDNVEKIKKSSKKIKIIKLKENIYVNPAWNLGVECANSEIVALLNDDITLADDFCSNVIEKMNPEMGIAGICCDFVEVIRDIYKRPKKEDLYLEELKYRNMHYGIAMFFYKSAYNKIPDDIKIFYGDDWIFNFAQKQGRKNYAIKGQTTNHYGSLSTGSMGQNPLFRQDKKNYKKHTLKWYQYIFDIEKIYKGFRLRIFNIEITKHFGKNW